MQNEKSTTNFGIWPEPPAKAVRDVTRIWPRVNTETFVRQRLVQMGQKQGQPDLEIPPGYDDNRVVLLVRDPYCLFAYWEVNDDKRREVGETYSPDVWQNGHLVLRLRDLSSPLLEVWDVPVQGLLSTWYVPVPWPGHTYQADLGLMAPGGHFILLASSNLATTPSAGVSAYTDEEWLTIEEIYRTLSFQPVTATSPGLAEALAGQQLVHVMGSHFLFGSQGQKIH